MRYLKNSGCSLSMRKINAVQQKTKNGSRSAASAIFVRGIYRACWRALPATPREGRCLVAYFSFRLSASPKCHSLLYARVPNYDAIHFFVLPAQEREQVTQLYPTTAVKLNPLIAYFRILSMKILLSSEL